MNIEVKISSTILHVIILTTVSTACMPLNKNMLSATVKPNNTATIVQHESSLVTREIISETHQTNVPEPISKATATEVTVQDHLITPKSNDPSPARITPTPKPSSQIAPIAQRSFGSFF